MKQLLFIVTICQIFLGCGNDDTPAPVEKMDYIVINGKEKTLLMGDDKPRLAISYGFGGYTFYGGEADSVYYCLTINDPNDTFLNAFDIPELQNSLKLYFIVNPTSASGWHATVPESTSVHDLAYTDVSSNAVINDGTPLSSDSEQLVLIQQLPLNTIVQFSNIRYGSYTISGKFTLYK